MGPITGLATIATALIILLLVTGLAVLGLTLAVVVPALREQRARRIAQQVSLPRWYLTPHPAH